MAQLILTELSIVFLQREEYSTTYRVIMDAHAKCTMLDQYTMQTHWNKGCHTHIADLQRNSYLFTTSNKVGSILRKYIV